MVWARAIPGKNASLVEVVLATFSVYQKVEVRENVSKEVPAVDGSVYEEKQVVRTIFLEVPVEKVVVYVVMAISTMVSSGWEAMLPTIEISFIKEAASSIAEIGLHLLPEPTNADMVQDELGIRTMLHQKANSNASKAIVSNRVSKIVLPFVNVEDKKEMMPIFTVDTSVL